jgi:predicted Zn-dependent protease
VSGEASPYLEYSDFGHDRSEARPPPGAQTRSLLVVPFRHAAAMSFAASHTAGAQDGKEAQTREATGAMPIARGLGLAIPHGCKEGQTMRTIAVVAALSISACSAVQRQRTERAVAEVLISDDQEFQLGLQVHEELKKQNTRFNEDPTVGLYVDGLARKLLAQANRDRKLDWMYFVIDDPRTINAFATPGGRIYVYTGLLLAAENEAEVVGVLGHEIGHVVARHSARQLVGAYGLQTVTEMALGKDASDVSKLVAGLVGKGALLAYGRDMELEADEYGARYAAGAGYDPRGLATFFEKLRAKYGDTGPVLTWFSTHPSNTDRIDRLTRYIAANQLSGSETGGDALKKVQAALGKR